MRELFHTATGAGRTRLRPARRRAHARQNPSVRALIGRGAARLARAGVYFGHGTDNAWDEAAAIVLHALGLPQHGDARLYRRRVGRDAGRRVRALLARRIAERIPAAYLTGVAWFAGVPLK
ncbi:MAG: hypothetical protein JO173_03110, partial [Gammaproteobacteria bacterium]|nr:hypothetical protein [Gammaproteobacteria bacterium]